MEFGGEASRAAQPVDEPGNVRKRSPENFWIRSSPGRSGRTLGHDPAEGPEASKTSSAYSLASSAKSREVAGIGWQRQGQPSAAKALPRTWREERRAIVQHGASEAPATDRPHRSTSCGGRGGAEAHCTEEPASERRCYGEVGTPRVRSYVQTRADHVGVVQRDEDAHAQPVVTEDEVQLAPQTSSRPSPRRRRLQRAELASLCPLALTIARRK